MAYKPIMGLRVISILYSGEAQVNDRIPKTGYPTTTCHEMAHQIGFAAENEANFVGLFSSKL